MIPTPRARIVKGAFLREEPSAAALAKAIVGPGTARRIAKAALEQLLSAERVLESAREEAGAIVAAATRDAAEAIEQAAREARERETAKLAALYVALRMEDERRAERDLERSVALAVVLAERLLGEAIEQNPAHIASLARQALEEARGTRRIAIEAHPLDAEALKGHLEKMGAGGPSIDLRENALLGRGSLRVHTNLGTLDAQLTPQLERLAQALRDALRGAR